MSGSHYAYAEVLPLAPALPAAGEGLAALFPLIAWGICLSLLYIWRRSIGAVFEHLASVLDVGIHIPHLGHVRPFGFVAAELRRVDYAVQGALDSGAKATERATVYLFHKSMATFAMVGHELAALSHATATALLHLTTTTIPREVRAGTNALTHELHALPGQIRRETHAALRPLTRTVSRVDALAHRTAIALPRDIARVGGRIGRAERTLERDAARLSRLEKALGITALTAAVVTVLGRLGLRWLRCGNVKRAGRSICGMDPSLLESVLADALLVGGALSLVDLAEHMQGVVGESAGLIQRFWDAA